jgi:hypothetical protein
MNPTLREPELMEIVPYGDRPVRVGDVVLFLPPQGDQPVVHRVARVTTAGISTFGDNNAQEDTFLLQPQHIEGQAVAAWRGQQRRTIPGGLRGHLTARWLRWRRIPKHRVFQLLHPLYDALSRCGLIARFLPAPFRPRAVVFHNRGQNQFRLLLGHHVVGQYDNRTRRWKIQRPFSLVVNERELQRQQDQNRTGVFCVIEGSQP